MADLAGVNGLIPRDYLQRGVNKARSNQVWVSGMTGWRDRIDQRMSDPEASLFSGGLYAGSG